MSRQSAKSAGSASGWVARTAQRKLEKKAHVSAAHEPGVACPRPSYAQSIVGRAQPAQATHGAGLTGDDVALQPLNDR